MLLSSKILTLFKGKKFSILKKKNLGVCTLPLLLVLKWSFWRVRFNRTNLELTAFISVLCCRNLKKNKKRK